jgi:hypothetical protein
MSKKNCGRIFGSEVEAFRRKQIVKDAKNRTIKKAEELVSRKQNSGGRFFAETNGHGRHSNQ